MKGRIIIDPEKCVGCGDCSLVCPVLVYTRWKDLSEGGRQRISQLSLEERHINFSNVDSKLTKRATQLAAKVFAYIDVENCLGRSCKHCADYCSKNAITIEQRKN